MRDRLAGFDSRPHDPRLAPVSWVRPFAHLTVGLGAPRTQLAHLSHKWKMSNCIRFTDVIWGPTFQLRRPPCAPALPCASCVYTLQYWSTK